MSSFHPQKYVSFGDNKTPNITAISGCNIGCRFCKCLTIKLDCGKTGIRTLGTRKGTTVFETVPIDHSGIFPIVVDGNGNRTATLMRSQRYERFLALRKFLTVKIPYLCP